MLSTSEILQSAVQHHRAGRLDEAERSYRQLLANEPGNADALHLLGLVRLANGDTTQAIDHLRKAVDRNGDSAEFRQHLAVALKAAGRPDDAIAQLRAAIALAPRDAGLQNDLGGLLRASGESVGAESAYREAIRLNPAMPEPHNNLGNLLQDAGRLAEALESLETAVRLAPTVAELHFNLGNCLVAQGNWERAVAAYQQAIAIKPAFAAAHCRLGAALATLHRHAEAAVHHGEAVRLDPQHVEAHTGLGLALQALGRYDEAMAAYRQALALRPEDATAQYNLGTALYANANYAEAERCFRTATERAPDYLPGLMALAQACWEQADLATVTACVDRVLQVEPEHAEARFFRAKIRLSLGQWSEGWDDLEYRLRLPGTATRSLPAPRWDGSRLGGGTLLIHAEYGLGDTLQFVRYAPLARERAGGRVLLEVSPALIPLLAESGFTDLVAQGAPLPHVDREIPIMSLPGIFQTTLDTVPGRTPYLTASPALVESWRKRLAGMEGFRVGIHWQGNPAYIGDRHRSIPPVHFAALARVPEVSLVSLQKDAPPQAVAAIGPNVVVFDDLDRDHGAFMDTAAVMKNLDLVITSDTAAAHLAGALGVPVWLALSVAPEWRWLAKGDASPWYPTMRLFRQSRLDEWTSVFEQIAEELRRLVNGN